MPPIEYCGPHSPAFARMASTVIADGNEAHLCFELLDEAARCSGLTRRHTFHRSECSHHDPHLSRRRQLTLDAFYSTCPMPRSALREIFHVPTDWFECAPRICATHLESGEVWLNRVGTFGVSSAAFHWARLLSGILRFVYYMWGDTPVSHMVFVDDMEWVAEGPKGLRCILIAILMMIIVGVPFAWHKFRGGVTRDWIGFRVCLRSRSIGLGPKRTEWALADCDSELRPG